VTSEEGLKRTEELLDRLEQARAELERVSETGDSDKAIEILAELAEIAKQVEAELAHTRRTAES
jgi:hypothetical protein